MKSLLYRINLDDLYALDQEIKESAKKITQASTHHLQNGVIESDEKSFRTDNFQDFKNPYSQMMKLSLEEFKCKVEKGVRCDEYLNLIGFSILNQAPKHLVYLLSLDKANGDNGITRQWIDQEAQNMCLLLATQTNQSNILKILFEHGMRFYILGDEEGASIGQLCLFEALSQEYCQCLDLLLKYLYPENERQLYPRGLDQFKTYLNPADVSNVTPIPHFSQPHPKTLPAPETYFFWDLLKDFALLGKYQSFAVLNNRAPNIAQSTIFLNFAAQLNNRDMVQACIEHHRQNHSNFSNMMSLFSTSILNYCVQYGSFDVFFYCIEQGFHRYYQSSSQLESDIKKTNHQLLLNECIRYGRCKEVRVLLAVGINPYQTDGQGLNAFEMLNKMHLESQTYQLNHVQKYYMLRITQKILQDLKRYHALRDEFYELPLGGLHVKEENKEFILSYQPASLETLALHTLRNKDIVDDPSLSCDLLEKYQRLNALYPRQ